MGTVHRADVSTLRDGHDYWREDIVSHINFERSTISLMTRGFGRALVPILRSALGHLLLLESVEEPTNIDVRVDEIGEPIERRQ